MLLTETNMEIFTKELCLECPDAPMDECPCGCMKKAIRNALQEGFEARKKLDETNLNLREFIRRELTCASDKDSQAWMALNEEIIDKECKK